MGKDNDNDGPGSAPPEDEGSSTTLDRPRSGNVFPAAETRGVDPGVFGGKP
jgi:hypothetical protein